MLEIKERTKSAKKARSLTVAPINLPFGPPITYPSE